MASGRSDPLYRHLDAGHVCLVPVGMIAGLPVSAVIERETGIPGQRGAIGRLARPGGAPRPAPGPADPHPDQRRMGNRRLKGGHSCLSRAGRSPTVTAASACRSPKPKGHPLARPGTTGMSSVQTTSIIRAGDFGDQQCWDGPVHLAEAGQGGDSQAWPPGSSPLGSSRGSPVAELAAARAAAATPAAASGA